MRNPLEVGEPIGMPWRNVCSILGQGLGWLSMRCQRLRMGRHVAGQLVRCGTSPAPNYAEGCAAESRADFVHKLRIVLKELRETRVWLRLSVKSKLLPIAKLSALIDECSQCMNIIGKSIVTANTNSKNERPR
jgi:four helix bundle protein